MSPMIPKAATALKWSWSHQIGPIYRGQNTQLGEGLATWRCSVQNYSAHCRECSTSALHLTPVPLPLSPSKVCTDSLDEPKNKWPPPTQLNYRECFAISVETNFTANCSGYHWGHLGVCIVCGNCFISAGKENTYYHVFAPDSSFCVGNHSHLKKRGQWMTHTAAVSRTACSYCPAETLLTTEELSEDTLHSAQPMLSRGRCHPVQTRPGALTQT